MLAYTVGVMALIVFLYRLVYVMLPMLLKATTPQQMFNSFTLLV